MSLALTFALLAASFPDMPPDMPPPPRAEAIAAKAAQDGVIRYAPDFFADAHPNTAMDMVTRLPGFSFDGGADVRGFAGAAGNVLVDGERPTSKQDNLQSVLSRIPASQVDHLEIIRGGAPGVDMQGRTVIANVVRKAGSGLQTVASVTDGAYYNGRQAPSVRLELSRRQDGRTLEGSIVAAHFVDDGAGDGPRVRTDSAGTTLIRSDLHANAGGNQATATGAYETPLGDGKFRVNGLLSFNNYSDDEDDHLSFPAPALETLRDRQHREKTELGVHYEQRLTPRTSLELLAVQQVRWNDYRSTFTTAVETDVFHEADTAGESIARAVVRFERDPKLSIEGAVEGAYNVQKSDSRFAVNGGDIPLPAAKVTVSEKRGEASLSATWKPASKFVVEAALRAEVSNIASTGDAVLEKTLFYPKPRLLLTWSPDAADQVRLRLERKIGQLNFSDFAASSNLGAGQVRAGNPDLKPWQAWEAEAAYEKHFGKAVAVLTLRRAWISDVVDRIPIYDGSGGVFDAPGNIGSAVQNDLALDITLPLDQLGLKHGQIKAQGGVRDSRVTDPTTGQMRRISGQRPFNYEAHFTHDLPKLKANWGIDVFNRWTQKLYRFNEIDVYKLKTWVDVFIEYTPRPDTSLKLEVDNIGSRGFQRVLYVYPGPRNTSGLAYVDDRRQDFGPAVFFRVRRTWN